MQLQIILQQCISCLLTFVHNYKHLNRANAGKVSHFLTIYNL